MSTRRDFLAAAALTVAAARIPTAFAGANSRGGGLAMLPAAFAALEKRSVARLGVAVLDTGSGQAVNHRGNERFPMCSTFKWLEAACLLVELDRQHLKLEDTLTVPASVTLGNSPVTKERAGMIMTLDELAHAAVTRSDNTAANMLLERLGGPVGLTAKLRALGDTVTRLDRTETTLNESAPGDPRDTTTPLTSVDDLRRFVLGDVLTPASRTRLITWLVANETGSTSLRAGFPKDWRVGDRTGSNGETTRNDVAVAWPPERAPIVVAAFITECQGPEETRTAMLAEIGRLVAGAV